MITYLEVNLVGYVMGDGNYWNELAMFVVGRKCRWSCCRSWSGIAGLGHDAIGL